MDDIFKNQENSIKSLKRLPSSVFGEVKRIRPCEEDPPRFTAKDCSECYDPCDKAEQK